jgi:hypothetical protein
MVEFKKQELKKYGQFDVQLELLSLMRIRGSWY